MATLQIENKPVTLHQTDWYWLFRTHITNQVNEDRFRQLFRARMRMPQGAVRVMVSMYLLQESFGWTDRQLMNECRSNFKVRYALGLNSMTESVPVVFAYNDFRNLLSEHLEKTGEDLVENFIDTLIREESPVMKVAEHSVILWSLNVA